MMTSKFFNYPVLNSTDQHSQLGNVAGVVRRKKFVEVVSNGIKNDIE